MSTQNTDRVQLTQDQRQALEQFAWLRIPLTELLDRLAAVLNFDFQSEERRLTQYYERPSPPIRITKSHIENGLNKRRLGEISGQELADWATMLLLNDSYDWGGEDEETIAQIADWLNDLSWLPSSEW